MARQVEETVRETRIELLYNVVYVKVMTVEDSQICECSGIAHK